MVASPPMKSSKDRKCSGCKDLYLPDRRNRHHQRFCSKEACRKQSKTISQQRWQQKALNQNYFRGAENSERVREWRKAHPGYWRKKESVSQTPLQDLCIIQVSAQEILIGPVVSDALQDVCVMQPALLVGLIATMTGSALQEDIAAAARSLLRKGRDILGSSSGVQTAPHCHDQTPPLSAATAPCAGAL